MLENEDNVHVILDIDNNVCPRSIDSGDRSDEDQIQRSEIVGVSDKQRRSIDSSESVESECSVELDLDGVVVSDVKVHLDKVERDCRICHLSMDMTNHESGIPMELGCSCKEDLAAAHKHCAETWFKIKGNKTCEICGSIAHNVAGAIEVQMTEQYNESSDPSMVPPTGPSPPSETRNFWQGHRFLNFLLACMVFAFVISWLFHFNVPS
ncbi:RING/FYVE/PHD zinc finger superfamily protein [Trifolium repens]|nr:RING/FYVE/PHD zinc finger superfamily protein [Trifolium repens]